MGCKILRVAGIVPDSIVDGEGLRLSIYTQGCPHRCDGCHNAQTWEFDGGTDMSVDDICAQIEANTLLDGITLTGGEPFCHAAPLIYIAQFAKSRGLSIWAWSGYTYDELLQNIQPQASELLDLCDVLVDGRFDMSQKTLKLPWRGSQNQRVIDLNKTRESGAVVEYTAAKWVDFEIPKWG